MHALKMLQQLRSGSLGEVHASRHAAVWVGMSALLRENGVRDLFLTQFSEKTISDPVFTVFKAGKSRFHP